MTGVQTCALPICHYYGRGAGYESADPDDAGHGGSDGARVSGGGHCGRARGQLRSNRSRGDDRASRGDRDGAVEPGGLRAESREPDVFVERGGVAQTSGEGWPVDH